MKKILGLLCISAMAFSLMSCGDKKNAKNAGELVVYGSCE